MLTESCAMNYCQDGLQVYFATETYDSIYGHPTDGHYELQPKDVNGRTYFKMGSYGFWYDGLGLWWIGDDIDKGQSYGYAYYEKDVFCPHQLSGLNWWTFYSNDNMYAAGNNFVITCKYNFHSKQNRWPYQLANK